QQSFERLGVADRMTVIGVVEIRPHARRFRGFDAMRPDFQFVPGVVVAIPSFGAVETDVDVRGGDNELVRQARPAAGAEDYAGLAECLIDPLVPPALVPELHDVPPPWVELGNNPVQPGARVLKAPRKLEQKTSHARSEKIGD